MDPLTIAMAILNVAQLAGRVGGTAALASGALRRPGAGYRPPSSVAITEDDIAQILAQLWQRQLMNPWQGGFYAGF